MRLMKQHRLTFTTQGRSTLDITDQINQVLSGSAIDVGLCHVFLLHTSASLILCENTDPAVRRDLEVFTQRWVPDGDPLFTHTAEGDDDMPAHIRSIFSHNDLTIPVADNRLVLGTWQGIYLWEHRYHSHSRTVVVSVNG